MNSLIMKYSLEEATPQGVKTGKFVFKKLHALLAAEEILETHMSMKPKEQKAFLDKNFEKTWTHFDTMNEGKLAVE